MGQFPWMLLRLTARTKQVSPKARLQVRKEVRTTKAERKEIRKVKAKEKKNVKEQRCQRSRMAKEDIVQFAALTKVKTVQPKNAISTLGHIPKVKAKKERKDPEHKHRRCS